MPGLQGRLLCALVLVLLMLHISTGCAVPGTKAYI